MRDSSSEESQFTRWWKRNGERWNKRRRARYDVDPAYRERVLETNRRSRQRRAQLHAEAEQ